MNFPPVGIPILKIELISAVEDSRGLDMVYGIVFLEAERLFMHAVNVLLAAYVEADVRPNSVLWGLVTQAYASNIDIRRQSKCHGLRCHLNDFKTQKIFVKLTRFLQVVTGDCAMGKE